VTAVRTAVLFAPDSPVHRLHEPGVTACRRTVPAGAKTAPRRDALLSALAYGIKLCGLCYPNRQMRTHLARRTATGNGYHTSAQGAHSGG
jgi:hypothetical protein